jgi:hypothetical protein
MLAGDTGWRAMVQGDKSVRVSEAEVAEAEQREARATLENDVTTLEGLWSTDLIVSSTANLVLTKSQALSLFRGGRIRLKTFERRISRTAVTGDIAIATGNESFTVKDDPANNEPPIDDLFICNYMNIWKREAGTWKMIGRHVGVMARMIGGAKAAD